MYWVIMKDSRQPENHYIKRRILYEYNRRGNFLNLTDQNNLRPLDRVCGAKKGENMSDEDSQGRDRLLDFIGVVLVFLVIFGVITLVIAAVNAPLQEEKGNPEVNWTVERVNSSFIRITHGGGDPIDARNITVTANGLIRSVTWSGTLTEGDSGLVRVEQGKTVRIYWTAIEGERALMLTRDV